MSTLIRVIRKNKNSERERERELTVLCGKNMDWMKNDITFIQNKMGKRRVKI